MKFRELAHQENQISLSISNESFSCFLSFFEMMKGYSFPFDNFDSPKLKPLIEYFGINSLFQNIYSNIPVPQTLEASLQFISQSCCELMENHFYQSISNIIQKFSSISFDDLCKIPNSPLLKIFASESLQIENEDYLFKLITSMIKEDKKRMVLLKSVYLDYVSGDLLKEFFENVPNEEIDFALLESLKKRAFANYSDRDRLSKRWKTKPKVLSQTEIIKQMKKENESLQQRNLDLEKAIEELKNPVLEGKTISYQNNHDGLLQDLISNPVSFSCSSIDNINPDYQPESILKYDNSTLFHSQNQPNSWICIKMNTKKVAPSGYLLRSWYGSGRNNLKNWTLEASNDNVSWIQLDQQIDRNWITKDWSEVYFPVNTKEAYSYFKFTQTGKNDGNQDYFRLNYVEFF
jgi:hypothetical protein